MNPLATKIEEVIAMIEPIERDRNDAYWSGDTVGLHGGEFEQFRKLAEDIRVEVIEAELEDRLPKPPTSGPCATALNLPGQEVGGYYKTDSTGDPIWVERFFELHSALPWIDQMRLVARLAEGSGKKKGQPKKGESNNDVLVLAALIEHHQYRQDGSVENFEPISNRQVAKMTGLSSNNALSRFLDRRVGEGQKRGYQRYKAACTKESLGSLLSFLSGTAPTYAPDLTPEEYGRR